MNFIKKILNNLRNYTSSSTSQQDQKDDKDLNHIESFRSISDHLGIIIKNIEGGKTSDPSMIEVSNSLEGKSINSWQTHYLSTFLQEFEEDLKLINNVLLKNINTYTIQGNISISQLMDNLGSDIIRLQEYSKKILSNIEKLDNFVKSNDLSDPISQSSLDSISYYMRYFIKGFEERISSVESANPGKEKKIEQVALELLTLAYSSIAPEICDKCGAKMIPNKKYGKIVERIEILLIDKNLSQIEQDNLQHSIEEWYDALNMWSVENETIETCPKCLFTKTFMFGEWMEVGCVYEDRISVELIKNVC